MCFNTPSFVDLMFGAWRLGATFVPVNHKLQAPEVDYVLETAARRCCSTSRSRRWSNASCIPRGGS